MAKDSFVDMQEEKEVIRMELTKEQMGFVQARAESVGLVMSYYVKFGGGCF